MNVFRCIWLLYVFAVFFVETTDAASRHLPLLDNIEGNPAQQSNNAGNVGGTSLNYRLPNDTYPEHYNIKLKTDVHTGERSFQGEVIIDIVIVMDTKTLVLHARQLEIISATATDASSGQSEDISSSYDNEREFLTLAKKSGTQFIHGTKCKITIVYNGKLRDDNAGFYMTSYMDEKGKNRYLAATRFESTDARHAFPCYDEPNKRAEFTITIIHDSQLSVISNMPVNDALTGNGKTVFLTTPPMPTYMVAFIVSDFKKSGGTLNNIPQQIYFRPTAKFTPDWVKTTAMQATEYFSEYFGFKFMLPKIDHVAVPNYAVTGLENWGLLTYQEKILLYDANTFTVMSETTTAVTIAHEICHQWFGNYVTIEWWTYLWVKEGFATLLSYKALDNIYPEWGIWQDFLVTQYQSAMAFDASHFVRSMNYYVEKPKEISRLYDWVSFSKAASVLHMWNNALTERVFQKGLNNFLTTNQYRAATELQLFNAIENAAKQTKYALPATISAMMSSWSHQDGYPLLTVKRNYDDGTFTITQEAFHHDESLKDNKTWYVPINYVVASNTDFLNTEATHYLLKVPKIKINVKIDQNDWLMINKQSAYYYRIKYDNENYNLLLDGLIKNPFKIHVHNRAQLLDDAYRLSFANRLDHLIPFKMLIYLKKEDQYAPWLKAQEIIKKYNFYLNGDDEYDDFKLFLADQIVPIYQKLGVNDIPGEQRYMKYTRGIVINLACLAGIEECLVETNNKLMALAVSNTTIEPYLQAEIFCNGLRQSSDKEFDFIYKKLMDSKDRALRKSLITALGCTQNEKNLKKFIQSSIYPTNELHDNERYDLLAAVYEHGGASLLACIDFLQKNWKSYAAITSDGFDYLEDDIRDMASFVVNKQQETKLLALVGKVKGNDNISPDIEVAVKRSIARNFKWLEYNRDPIMSWVAVYNTIDQYRCGVPNFTASTILIAFTFIATLTHLF